MVNYRKHILDNGLTVLTHEAWDTPLATVNVLYNVGARDEEPSRTGFAHLFEHLMFGGTRRFPDYDRVVSSLGGDNNAFTNCPVGSGLFLSFRLMKYSAISTGNNAATNIKNSLLSIVFSKIDIKKWVKLFCKGTIFD